MASNMNTVYNRLLKKPATAYNNWAQGPLQNTPASTEYVSHHFFNSWIPASLGPVFADLGSFPEFEEQEIDLISMRNPLLDGNFIVQSDIDTSRTLPHSMKAPLENVPLPISKDCTFSETKYVPKYTPGYSIPLYCQIVYLLLFELVLPPLLSFAPGTSVRGRAHSPRKELLIVTFKPNMWLHVLSNALRLDATGHSIARTT